MRLSGFLPVVGRKVVVALGVAVMMMVAASAQAQTPATAAAQPEAPDQFKFDGSKPVMVLLSITKGQEAAFEAGWSEMKAGLAASPKPEFQAQAKSLNLLKVDAIPPDGQPFLYILYLDPPLSTVSYDITKTLYYSGAFDVSTPELRKKVDDIYDKFKVSLANQTIWPIIKK